MRRRVGLLVGLLAVVGVGGGWVAFGARFGGHKSAFHLEKSRVERGDVVGRVTATGALSALVTVQVGSQVSGRISNLYADFGQRVTRGQVVARLDPQLFQAALEQGRANRDAAAGALRRWKRSMLPATSSSPATATSSTRPKSIRTKVSM